MAFFLILTLNITPHCSDFIWNVAKKKRDIFFTSTTDAYVFRNLIHMHTHIGHKQTQQKKKLKQKKNVRCDSKATEVYFKASLKGFGARLNNVRLPLRFDETTLVGYSSSHHYFRWLCLLHWCENWWHLRWQLDENIKQQREKLSDAKCMRVKKASYKERRKVVLFQIAKSQGLSTKQKSLT